jgi:tetratricopeptide (TPR) repeat protein
MMRLTKRNVLHYGAAAACISTVFALFQPTMAPAFTGLFSPRGSYENNWQALITEGDTDIRHQRLQPAEYAYHQAYKRVKHSRHSTDDLVLCLQKFASTLTLESKTNESLPLYKKSLHILEREYGSGSPKIVPTLFAIGAIYETEGEPYHAAKLYQRTVDINEKSFGPASLQVADSLHRLGHASAAMGEFRDAEQQYRASLAILMQQSGPSSSDQLENLLGDYNDLLKKNDASDKNVASNFQSEELRDLRVQGPTAAVPPSAWQKQLTHNLQQSGTAQDNEDQQVLLRGFKLPLSESTLAPAYDAEAKALTEQHRYIQGEDQYKRMIAIDIKTLGEHHPSVADDFTGLALLYMSQHRYADAKPLLTRALAIYETSYGADNLLAVRTREYLASVYDKLGDKQQAANMYSSALIRTRPILAPNNLETARMLNELAFLYYSQGKLEDACTIYQWALASTKGAVGAQTDLTAACLTDYANVLRSLGRTAEAEQMDERAEMIKVKRPDS